jgi:hypothetical protein
MGVNLSSVPNIEPESEVQTFIDDIAMAFGSGSTAKILWETADANANALAVVLPAGGATDVPALVIGDASIEDKDLGHWNGITVPTVAVYNAAETAYLAMDGTPQLTFGLLDGTVNAANVDTKYVTIKARDSGVGLVEMARIVGAADPYLIVGRDDTGVSTSAVTDILVLQAGAGTNNESAGQGLGVSFKIGNGASQLEERASIDCALVTATDGSEDANLIFNLMDGGVAPAAVLTLVGADKSATFAGATTATKAKCTSNVGSANTGVTAVEYGDGYNHVSVLTVSQGNALTTGDNANLADGYLLYTLPAGTVVVDYAYMTMAITHDDAASQSDTPDVGLGTVEGSGAVATLDGTATFENIITGQTAANCNGTATVKTALPTAAVPFIIAAADAHTIYFNAADGWADNNVQTADIAGTVVLAWRFLA